MTSPDVQRTQLWLEATLASVWQRHFPDMVAANCVVIRFGRVARTRLGSIRLSAPPRHGPWRDKKSSTILINRLFQNPAVPLAIVEATIAHELVHYLHGFSSPFEQKFCSPHAGGVVTKELKARGFGEVLTFQKRWLKQEWPKLVREHGGLRRARRGHRHRQGRGLAGRRFLVRGLFRLLS